MNDIEIGLQMYQKAILHTHYVFREIAKTMISKF